MHHTRCAARRVHTPQRTKYEQLNVGLVRPSGQRYYSRWMPLGACSNINLKNIIVWLNGAYEMLSMFDVDPSMPRTHANAYIAISVYIRRRDYKAKAKTKSICWNIRWEIHCNIVGVPVPAPVCAAAAATVNKNRSMKNRNDLASFAETKEQNDSWVGKMRKETFKRRKGGTEGATERIKYISDIVLASSILIFIFGFGECGPNADMFPSFLLRFFVFNSSGVLGLPLVNGEGWFAHSVEAYFLVFRLLDEAGEPLFRNLLLGNANSGDEEWKTNRRIYRVYLNFWFCSLFDGDLIEGPAKQRKLKSQKNPK